MNDCTCKAEVSLRSCVQSHGYKHLIPSQAVCMQYLGSSQQKCGDLDSGLQFLCDVKDPKKDTPFFKASVASHVTSWHSLGQGVR